MATYFSILAWRIPWTEEPSELHTVHGVAKSDTTEQLTHFHLKCLSSFSSPALSSKSPPTPNPQLVQFSSVTQPSCLTLCDPMDCSQASQSITNSQSLLKLVSIESVMPSNCLILVIPFSSHLQSFLASGSFPMSPFFASGGQSIGVPASGSVLPMNIQD